MEPAQLQLEVTESLAAQDSLVQARLHELKALGVTLALDDFGTGYSSLASLHLLPVDTVKIDRSFVSAAGDQRPPPRADRGDGARGGQPGHGHGRRGHRDRRPGRCRAPARLRQGQGYLFSRPLEADDLLSWLGRWGVRLSIAGRAFVPCPFAAGVCLF